MRLSFLLGALALVACSSKSTTNGAANTADSGTNAVDSGTGVDSGAAPYLPAGYTLTPFVTDTATTHTYKQADQVIDSSKGYVAVLETTAGRIVWEFSAKDAPVATNSFVFLTLHHYFEGIAFHRVIDGFVAQGGDPNSISKAPSTWGTGGPGYAFDNENTDGGANFDDAAGGIVAMANTGQPKSNGSQFFITFGAQNSLDGGYTIFGKVTEGMDVLPSIVRGEPPTNPTRITEAHIGEKSL